MKAKYPYSKKTKRVGNGVGSGTGKTGGRGQKGQRSRSGGGVRPGFEGGQTPLYRRLPKRGFNNVEFCTEYAVLNLDRIAELGESEINPEMLVKRGIVKNLRDGLKILGTGELTKPVTVKAHRFSESAKEKIVKAGGQAVQL